jgi:hypothetical protein
MKNTIKSVKGMKNTIKSVKGMKTFKKSIKRMPRTGYTLFGELKIRKKIPKKPSGFFAFFFTMMINH